MRHLLWLFVLSLLAGCAATSRCITLPDAPRYCLQPPAANYSANQLVTVSGRGLQELSVMQLEADANALSLAVMSPLGQSLLSARWDGKQWQAESAFGARIRQQGGAMLALAQWLHLPEAQVLQGFGHAPVWWRHRDAGQRSLMHCGEVLMEIETQADGQRLTLPGLGLKLDITALPDIEEEQESK